MINKTKLIEELKNTEDIDAYAYDGSYKLMNSIVEKYALFNQFSKCTYLDLNAIYGMAIGTWKLNVEKKKEYVKYTCLFEDSKKQLIDIIDDVWDDACQKKYIMCEQSDKPSIGMFGTGFYSFENKTNNDSVKKFINLLADIQKMNDDTLIYDAAEKVLVPGFKGMKAASASVILHCLKPETFPVLNSNQGNDNIYTTLGINLVKPDNLETYIKNCRRISTYRNEHFPFKNYRVLDLAARNLNKFQEEDLEEEVSMDNKQDKNTIYDKNMILYGPPGTGKTFHTMIYAVAIIEKKSIEDIKREAQDHYAVVKKRYEDYMEEGRIAFTTFHQSYGYEEFIEGIKPKLSEEESLDYTVEDGVFKKFCNSARVFTSDVSLGLNKSPAVWKVSLGGTYDNPVREECLKNGHIRIGWDVYGPDLSEEDEFKEKGKAVLNAFLNKMKVGDIVLSCYTASTIDAIGIVTGEYEWDDSYDQYKRVRKVDWIVKGIQENIVDINGGSTMTLSTVYQMKIDVSDVLELIQKTKPERKRQSNQVSDKNYVFIIDEINRGNISKIFGELITLIEPTKRIGEEEQMFVTLPYSPKERPFGVPNNVYLLGTMNTADRSIALMDTALRRRFSFVEMMPESEVLRDLKADKVVAGNQELDVATMLDVINERIEYLYDREHTIGHAFFTGLAKDSSIDKLAEIFEKSVIPLLQEYFYEDYSRIQLVLGDDGKQSEDLKQYQFIRDEEIKVSDIFNTVPDVDLPPKKYEIQKESFRKIESYKLISRRL
ncbi:MAG: AAA family ATPase [Eubacteriales bacterium]|nr:AAA family ATPase [Eubacteriales bacterium]